LRISLDEAIDIINWLQSLSNPDDRLREMLNVMEGKLETYLITATIEDNPKPPTTH
jgi:hypothetical protein